MRYLSLIFIDVFLSSLRRTTCHCNELSVAAVLDRMPIFSRNNCVRKSGDVSISKFPAGSPKMALARSRWFRGLVLRQTAQPQPIAGTPTDVPVPSRII